MRFSTAAIALFAASAAAWDKDHHHSSSDCESSTTPVPVSTPSSTPCETPSQSSTPVASPTATVSPVSTPTPGASVVTEVVTDFTTYCPEATTFTHGSSTYSVTGPTTLTLPGTISVTRPILSSTVTICNNCPASTGGFFTPPVVSPVYPNSTAPAVPTQPAPSSPAPYTAGASRSVLGAGAGLAALFAAAVYLL